jgi:hypothetical protein
MSEKYDLNNLGQIKGLSEKEATAPVKALMKSPLPRSAASFP